MKPQDSLKLLACQIDIPPTTTAAARDTHLAETAAELRKRLAKQNVDLVVLPELSSIDYSRAAFEQLDEIAERLDGESFRTWSALAVEFGTYVCYSFARKAEDAFLITIAVVNPKGALVGHYDKLHLAQYGASMEKEYFTRGDHLLVFDVKGFKLAPFICYDIRFPELARTLVLDHGVDVILHCGAYFRDPSFHTWHAFAITRAIENQVFLLSLNRAGHDYGNSLFCPPWVDETKCPQHFSKHGEDFRHITIDRQEMIDARRNYAFLHDKRDSYNRPCQGRNE